jgi:hypothetical protein
MTEAREDVVDLTIGRALGQSAELVVVREAAGVGELGSIAAILRF